MSLTARLMAHFSTLSMAVPARLALWVGLVCVAVGYQQKQPAFTVAGCALIVSGVGLWLWFRPRGGGWKQMVGLRPRPGTPVAAKVKPNAKKASAAAETAAALEQARNHPRLQAKRRPPSDRPDPT